MSAADGSRLGSPIHGLLAVIRTLRRHWVLILTLTVAGAVAGAASAELNKKTTESKTFYKATTTLVVELTQRAPLIRPARSRASIRWRSSPPPATCRTVAKKLGSDEAGGQLAEHIAHTNGDTSTIAITAAEPTAEEARRSSPTPSRSARHRPRQEGSGRVLDRGPRSTPGAPRRHHQPAQRATTRRSAATHRTGDTLQAQYDTLTNQYRITYDSYAQLAAQGPPTSRFSTLQKAQASPDRQDRVRLSIEPRRHVAQQPLRRLRFGLLENKNTDAVVSSPSSSPVDGPVSRGVLGAFLGLLVGVGLAFVVERLDRRIRTRAEAEAAFRLPVLAEVPQIEKVQRRDSSSSPYRAVVALRRGVSCGPLLPPVHPRRHGGRAGGDRKTTGRTATHRGAQCSNLSTTSRWSSWSPRRRPARARPRPSPTWPRSSPRPALRCSSSTATSAARRSTATSVCDDEPRRVQRRRARREDRHQRAVRPASNPAQVVAAQRQVIAAARAGST